VLSRFSEELDLHAMEAYAVGCSIRACRRRGFEHHLRAIHWVVHLLAHAYYGSGIFFSCESLRLTHGGYAAHWSPPRYEGSEFHIVGRVDLRRAFTSLGL